MMLAVQLIGHELHIRRIRIRLKLRGMKILLIVFIIQGKGMEHLSFCRKFPCCHGADDAGIQPAGEKCPYRHICLQLPVDRIQQ